MHTINEKMQFLWKSFFWLSIEEFSLTFFFLGSKLLREVVTSQSMTELNMKYGCKKVTKSITGWAFPLLTLAHIWSMCPLYAASEASSERPPVLLLAQGMTSFDAFHSFKVCLQYFLWGWSLSSCLCPWPWSDQCGLRIHFSFIFFPLSVLILFPCNITCEAWTIFIPNSLATC